MSVEFVKRTKEEPSALAQAVSMGDVFNMHDEANGDSSIVVLAINSKELMIFELDDLSNRWSDTKVATVGDVVEILGKFDTVTSIEYFRQLQIDVKVTVGDSVRVL